MRDAMRSDRGIYREAILQLSVWSTVVGLIFSSSNSPKIHSHNESSDCGQKTYSSLPILSSSHPIPHSHSVVVFVRVAQPQYLRSTWDGLDPIEPICSRFHFHSNNGHRDWATKAPHLCSRCPIRRRPERSPDSPTLLYYPRVVV